ncbi:hypothetical protein CANARDRAFT_193377 [[Candida] arabinofermentans NRRL YB-2248]|uniref:ubiquitinyl hydrolase 1 n=1 Tax=[Candida] arabinofermentans NRRL YB-2248 TaxID=983967 RepID=A0A1E4T816_9ASCO|nr:hypothetical protein CANARDRAFT_193377 [[Candida] arabinofermentans NRRL YB-2248]
MFKKWKSDKSSTKNGTSSTTVQAKSSSGLLKSHGNSLPPASSSTSSNIDSNKVETAHIESANHILEEEPYDPELDYKVINPINKAMPYGDGSNKVYGMENFGYTCYIASILQALYYTEPFRNGVLTFPQRDDQKPRKRKVRVAGVKTHAFTASAQQLLQQNQTQQQQQPNGQNGKMRNLFGGKHNDSNGNTNGTTVNTSHAHAYYGLGSAQLNNPDLEKLVVSKYPSFKDIKLNYSLNHQMNITIVGVTNDLNANSEQRKRQALISGPIINLDHGYNELYGMEANLYTSLKDTFESMAENISPVGIVSAQNLVEVVKKENEMFRSSMHQDAHEFLNFLINSVLELVDQYCTSHSDQQSSLHDIFEGLLVSETKCLSCENVSTRDELFLDLSIDLQQNTSITNCLKMFSQSEMLTESNKFFCENCHSLQEAAKTIKLKKLPKILALHLKRFKYAEDLGRNVKLFYRVEYPKTLRIFNTTDDTETPDKLYELYAVVVHIGGGPYHGHYVSLVKTPKFGWLLFDDETVESIDENYVYRFFGDGPGLSTAYLLFYKEVEDEEDFRNRTLFNGLDDNCNEDSNIDAGDILSGTTNAEQRTPAPQSSSSNADDMGMDDAGDSASDTAYLQRIAENINKTTIFHWLFSLIVLVITPSFAMCFAFANSYYIASFIQIVCAIYAVFEALFLRFPDPSGHENSASRGTAWFLAFFYCFVILLGSLSSGSSIIISSATANKFGKAGGKITIVTYKVTSAMLVILYGMFLSAMLVVPWLRLGAGQKYSQEMYDSTMLTAWGIVNTFTEHRPWEPWSHGDYQHTSMGIIFWACGMLGMYMSRNNKRNYMPALTLMFTGYAMSGHVQKLMISTKVHGFFGWVLIFAGFARIWEISFVLRDERCDKDKIHSFQYLPSFGLILAGVLFMGATEEQLQLVVDMGADHSSYIMVLSSCACLIHLWFLIVFEFYLRLIGYSIYDHNHYNMLGEDDRDLEHSATSGQQSQFEMDDFSDFESDLNRATPSD